MIQQSNRKDAQRVSEIENFVQNSTPDLNTFLSLIDYISSTPETSSYFHKNQQLKHIPHILKILARRSTLVEVVQSMMALDHNNAIHLLMNHEDQKYQELTLNYLGLYPFISAPPNVQIPQIYINMQNYSGNPFWIASQNQLYNKVHSDYFKVLKKTHPYPALILAILIGDQSEIQSCLLTLQFEWSNIVWTKLYTYYRQQLVSRIFQIQKQQYRLPSQNLKCLQNNYSLKNFDWKSIEENKLQRNSLDIVNLFIIRSIIQSNGIDIDKIFQKIRLVGDQLKGQQEAAIKSAIYLYHKYPSERLKEHLLNFISKSDIEEDILPLIFNTNQQIADYYFKKSQYDRSSNMKIQNFKVPKLRSMIAQKYLNADDSGKNNLSTIKHLMNPIEKVKYSLQFLPSAQIYQIESALQIIKPLLDNGNIRSNSNYKNYLNIYSNYLNILPYLSDQCNEDNFYYLYNWLCNPSQQIMNVNPPQYNRYLLAKAINCFFQNALYLIEIPRNNNKAQIFDKCKQLTVGIQSYVHDILSQTMIIENLNKGMYQIIIRDSEFLADVSVQLTEYN